MPVDPTPDGAGILNKPVVKPFPQPTPEDDGKGTEQDGKGGEGGRGDQDDPLAGAGREKLDELEKPLTTTRPPLGN
ncbi:MAG: hypothetical protein EOO54_05655 [Haliea sp.]|nr:MAG: hypothetical protein EOO54_05655 [Haliea sp.]